MMEATTNQNSRPLDVPSHSKAQQAVKPPSIGSEKQYRFVEACLYKVQSTKALLAVCAVTNVGDVAKKLRGRGWLIDPVKADAKNRYGENADAYYWHILTPLDLCEKALNEWRIKHTLSDS